MWYFKLDSLLSTKTLSSVALSSICSKQLSDRKIISFFMLCHHKIVVIFHFCNSISKSITYFELQAMAKSIVILLKESSGYP